MARFFDVFFSLLAIIVFSPLLMLIVILLLLTGEHQVFYKQVRIGRNQKSFKVLKFATMLKNSEQLPGGEVTSRNDPRVLKVGKVLRKTKLNELPQLFNILGGSMSVIGPRPITEKQFSKYTEEQREVIASVRPGLSGLGSLIFRDEETILSNFGDDYEKTHSEIISPYKGDLECWFVNNNSIILYFKLILLTCDAIIHPSKKYLSKFRNIPTPNGDLQKYV